MQYLAQSHVAVVVCVNASFEADMFSPKRAFPSGGMHAELQFPFATPWQLSPQPTAAGSTRWSQTAAQWSYRNTEIEQLYFLHTLKLTYPTLCVCLLACLSVCMSFQVACVLICVCAMPGYIKRMMTSLTLECVLGGEDRPLTYNSDNSYKSVFHWEWRWSLPAIDGCDGLWFQLIPVALATTCPNTAHSLFKPYA